MRNFNGKKIELLAPAGNLEIFKGIVDSRCDAIYFGGQRMNMRMIRKGFNFSDEELKEAVDLAKEREKATYITVNNLIDANELSELDDYLLLLEDIKPTGIIVQDMAVLERANALRLTIEKHASVMFNVHNTEMIHALESLGVSRVVLSREATLADAARFKREANLELEYFTHGDMCIAHGAQCYYSAMLYGMSSNRGKCLKPCRWWFEREGKQEFPLAVKDMSMIAHLPEMIHAGITSFKIEGRMRERDFIVNLINHYGDVLDAYIADPVGYDYKGSEAWIYENRKRDLSTAYAFGTPGVANINTRYEGTGKFYSTGKMFSTPTAESKIELHQVKNIKEVFDGKTGKGFTEGHKLSVRVMDMAQARIAFDKKVDRIYLSADVFEPKTPFTLSQIKELISEKGDTEVYWSLPKMMSDAQIETYHAWFKRLKAEAIHLDGLLVTNLGALHAFKGYGYKMVGDYSLNLFNDIAVKGYKKLGLSAFTPSIEIPAEHLANLLASGLEFEVISHGRLTSMYLSHDLYKAYGVSTDEALILENEGGKYLIRKDVNGMCHLLMQMDYSLVPLLNDLPASRFRIEAQEMSPEKLKAVIDLHHTVLSSDVTIEEALNALNSVTEATLGATRF